MTAVIASSKLSVIIGLGITGLSVARFLARENRPFVVLDTREKPPMLAAFDAEFPEHRCVCGPLDQALLLAAEQIILSPGLAKAHPAIVAAQTAGVELLGDIELFARKAAAPIIAITGSNGKTTVTTLVGGMAKAAGLNVLVGGNIGTPALDLLTQPAPDFYVLELSSFQLETTHQLNAHSAVVLNVTQDHMDRYPNFAAYHAAKMRIFFGVKNMVVNRDDPLSQGIVAQTTSQLSFGLSKPDLKQFGIIAEQGEPHLAQGLTALLPVSRLNLRGTHNHSNALAAMALLHTMGALNQGALDFLAQFPGVKHRCQTVAEKNGIIFINDSKATNVGATLAALVGLSAELAGDAKILLILGGQGKGADFTELLPGLSESVKTTLVLGEDADKISAAIAGHVPVVRVTDLNSAVETAYQQAEKGDLVLLSPACASFDMFNGYEARGEAFIHAVEALAA